MRIQRFVAADMRQAIRSVRETLGADAVILSNRKIDEGVEVTAAVDFEAAAAQPAPTPTPAPRRSFTSAYESAAETEAAASEDDRFADDLLDARESTSRPAPLRPAYFEGAAPSFDTLGSDPLGSMSREIRSLRALLEQQVSRLAWADLERRDPVRQGVMRRLLELRLQPEIAEAITASLPDHLGHDEAWQGAQAWLCGRTRVTATT